jgi:arylsulfatase A-like enzyme
MSLTVDRLLALIQDSGYCTAKPIHMGKVGETILRIRFMLSAMLAVTLWPGSGSAATISEPLSSKASSAPGAFLGLPFAKDMPADGLLALASADTKVAATASFDGLQYIASYPDLIRALGANRAAGERHYQQYGRAEGRSQDSFNEQQYLANYADLRAAFGSNVERATIHYITHGYYEGRTDKGTAPGGQPNFVVFFVDDVGYGEVGAVHQPDVSTPNIDAIAAAGVVATSGYVMAPVCAPSRAGLLTGRYPQTLGIYKNPPPQTSPGRLNGGLPSTAGTVAEGLRTLGYATGMVGKWNVGYRLDQHPLMRGFDEFFGVLGSDHPYYGEMPGNPVLRGFTPEPQADYLTDAFAREAVSFIRRHAAQRFFLYLPFTAIHTPLQAKPDKLVQFADIANSRRRTVAAMLSSLDDAVGAVLRTLREQGLADNTVVAFLGDNGCGNCKNGPLRGGKGTFYDGGIRVPFIVSWPGALTPGSRSDVPVSAMDLTATIIEAAGGSAAGLDGGNLVAGLRGTADPNACLFWGARENGAARCGDWKLIERSGHPPQLYDLKRDIGESRNVGPDNWTVVTRLRQLRADWLRTLAPRTW